MPTSKQRRGFERARQEIGDLALRGFGRAEFVPRVADLLREAIPFDGGCWHTADPASLLITSHWTNLGGDGFPAICNNEYAVSDVNKFASLAGRQRPASSLRSATAGVLESSARYREIFGPRGWCDELRISFDSAGATWGSAMLLRAEGEPPFSAEETAFAASVGRSIADGLRTSLLAEAGSEQRELRPALLVFDEQGELDEAGPDAEALLAELGTEHVENQPLPTVLATVRAATLGDHGRTPRARVKTRSGDWLTLHGTRMGDGPCPRVAVIIEPAGSVELGPLIAAAYGLTERERSVAYAVARGLGTDEIARLLVVSPWTVQDHLKSIFEKTGTNGRAQLVARLFFEQYLPWVDAHKAEDPSSLG